MKPSSNESIRGGGSGGGGQKLSSSLSKVSKALLDISGGAIGGGGKSNELFSSKGFVVAIGGGGGGRTGTNLIGLADPLLSDGEVGDRMTAVGVEAVVGLEGGGGRDGGLAEAFR